MTNYSWKPIEALSDGEKAIDLAAMRPLYENWRAWKRRLQASSQKQLAEFNTRLIRRLSIETGILERLYDLDRGDSDRGTTEALVANGFVLDLISHSSTNIEPSHLIDILRDQESAIQLVLDAIARKRGLTTGLLHELHTILTQHQDTTDAVDQFGRRYEIPLLKGKFKDQPNNPKRLDGSIHEYCPPIHVASEIEKLLNWLTEYSNEDPIIAAAWFHHRFTQIHPYQDGNGRLARALTTLILLREELLPLVVDRDSRTGYITSLELADQGRLSPLAEMFAGLERKAILQALSVDGENEIPRLTSEVIGSLAQKFGRRRLQKSDELRQVNSVARELRAEARFLLEDSFAKVSATLDEVGKPKVQITDGGPDRKNEYYYRFEVVQTARDAHKFANFHEDHYFIKGSVRVNRERMIFVVSFHHVGHELTGVMEATTFSKLVSYDDSDDGDSVSTFSPCSIEPFVFTNTTKTPEIRDSFRTWLDAALALAMKGYGERL